MAFGDWRLALSGGCVEAMLLGVAAEEVVNDEVEVVVRCKWCKWVVGGVSGRLATLQGGCV